MAGCRGSGRRRRLPRIEWPRFSLRPRATRRRLPPDDRRARVQTDPWLEIQTVLAAELLREGLHLFEHRDGRVSRSPSSVLDGHGVPETEQEPVLVALDHGPVEAARRAVACLLESLEAPAPGPPRRFARGRTRTRTLCSRIRERSPGGARPRERGGAMKAWGSLESLSDDRLRPRPSAKRPARSCRPPERTPARARRRFPERSGSVAVATSRGNAGRSGRGPARCSAPTPKDPPARGAGSRPWCPRACPSGTLFARSAARRGSFRTRRCRRGDRPYSRAPARATCSPRFP